MSGTWKPPLFEPIPARPFVSAVFDDPDAYLTVKKDLAREFGPIDYETPSFSSKGLTSLYGGAARSRIRFLSFERMVGLDELVDMRKKTLGIEVKRQEKGRPLIELDPGYVSEYTVVRTALEEDFHRIYLFHGIFAEILYYQDKGLYQPLSHTPTFFRQKDVITMFNDLNVIRSSNSSRR